MINYVSLDFKLSQSEAALVQFTTNILTRIKDNPKFPDLQALLNAQLQPAFDRYTVSLQEAADGSRSKIAEKRANRLVLLAALETMASHLNVVPELSESLILEAGFKPRRRGSRGSGAPEQVQGLRVVAGKHSGEAILEFDKVPQARLYGVEWSSDAGQQWHNGIYPSAHRAVVNGLPVRQEVWFRVFAIGTQQRKGAPSVPVPAFVL